VAGDETIQVIPAPHVVAGRRLSCTLTIDLQQAVVGERKVVRVSGCVVCGEGTASQLYVGVSRFVQRLRSAGVIGDAFP
jgi:hypothetical protein